jgi:hypothetical protein
MYEKAQTELMFISHNYLEGFESTKVRGTENA